MNALIPGTTDTEFLRKAAGAENMPDAVLARRAQSMGQKQRAGDQAPRDSRESRCLRLTLASDEHPFMTGTQMVLDGGKTARAG